MLAMKHRDRINNQNSGNCKTVPLEKVIFRTEASA